MVLDTSALVAIHLMEPSHEKLVASIRAAELKLIGAPTLFETARVLSRYARRDARPLLNDFWREQQVETVQFAEEHCDFSGLPLLFLGNDFSQTDVVAAI